MKYNVSNEIIPQEERQELNQKILYLIENKLCEKNDITQEDIFNAYTGDGGLHGLNYKDYNSYYDYSQAKNSITQGQFFTPYHITDFVVKCLGITRDDFVADLTMGHGAFINSVPNEENFYGNELDMKCYKVAKHLYPNANLSCGDIRGYETNVRFDYIVGNPPYNLKWGEYLSQLYYVIKSATLIKTGGIMAIVVPTSFLNDTFWQGKMFERVKEDWNFLCEIKLPNNAFKSVGVDNFETKIMFFQRKSEFVPEANEYTDGLLSLDTLDEKNATFIYEKYIKQPLMNKQKAKTKLLFENRKQDDDGHFEYELKKMLFAIKRHPKLKDKYASCEDYLYQYRTQKKPDDMKWEEWQKKRITEGKVLAYVRRVLKSQHLVERDVIKLVKTKSGLKYKAYSRKSKLKLNKDYVVTEQNMHELIIGYKPKIDNGVGEYEKLIKRKARQFSNQDMSFKDMSPDKSIAKWLNEFSLHNKYTDEIIKLNKIQKYDINLFLQKRYCFVAWSQGGGKTLAGIAQMLYRLQHNHIQNAFVVSTAISINNTWNEVLSAYGLDFIRIRKIEDVAKIKKGQIVIVTTNLLSKCQKQLKKYIKINNKNCMLVFDECDCITNPSSVRTKAMLNVFRQLKYKVLMTGTPTRNNICELEPQLELLYNNSVNMLCESEYRTVVDKHRGETKGELINEVNPYYMKPFPPYKKGYSLFSECFLPDKISVFGVAQKTQDIYNADILKELIDKTIITRTFSPSSFACFILSTASSIALNKNGLFR